MILQCPSCDSRNVTTVWTEHTFPYGARNPANLTAKVPVRRCKCCGESWLDYISEIIMDRVVTDFEGKYPKHPNQQYTSYQDRL